VSSDTCSLHIRVHPSHQTAVVAAFGVEPAHRCELSDLPHPFCVLFFDNVEAGRPLAALASQGIAFDGSHSACPAHPGRRFAAFGGELAAVGRAVAGANAPDDRDTPDQPNPHRLRRYRRLQARVRQALDREPEPPLHDIPIDALQLEEVGELEPWDRQLGSISIGGARFHVEAVAVHEANELRTQEALAPELTHSFALLAAAFGTDSGFQTCQLEGSDGRDHDYALFIYPHDR